MKTNPTKWRTERKKKIKNILANEFKIKYKTKRKTKGKIVNSLFVWLIDFSYHKTHTNLNIVIIIFLVPRQFNVNLLLTMSTSTTMAIMTARVTTTICRGTRLVVLALSISSMQQSKLATTFAILCFAWTMKTSIQQSTSLTSWQTLIIFWGFLVFNFFGIFLSFFMLNLNLNF